MTHSLSRRLAVLLAGALATLFLALALSSSPATASPFCGGQIVQRNRPCFGAERFMNGDTGYGQETSICIGASGISGPCSAGPGQFASLNIAPRVAVPWITGNAASQTRAWGETY